ncbi:MAG: colanic acid biosynthesis glycosyl transferase [Bacteroidetes bacterium]|nr:colanic acid biosynthesis glycosyl transferase [Bacteroidota bacterium]
MKVSVISINFNNKDGLNRTIESVLNQTYSNIEYIVIDGGSTDGSKNTIEENVSKITYSVSEKDNGIYDAMNKGIQKATGDYLLFLNSGDTLAERNTIEKVVPFLTGTEIVYGNLKISDKGTITEGFMPDELTLEHMVRDTLWHPVSFIRKDLFERFGLYETIYKICGDYDFFFKTVIANKVTTKHINHFIAVFELNGLSSDLKNAPIIKEEKDKIQRKYISEEEIKKAKTPEKKTNFFTKWFR